MKNKIFILFLILLFTACTNSEKKYKKEFSKAVKEEKLEVFEQKNGDIAFKLNKDNKEYKYIAKYSEEDTSLYGVGYIEKAEELTIDGNKLKLMSEDSWSQIQSQIFENTVPKESFKGALFLIHYFEFIAYRDENNKMIFSSLQNLPKTVEIVEKYDNKRFMEYTLFYLDELTKNETDDLIFPTSEAERDQMPYVFYDKDDKKIISLYNSYTGSENHQSISYLLAKNVVGLINNPVTVMGRLVFYIYNSAYVLTTQGMEIPTNIPPVLVDGENMNIDSFVEEIKKTVSKKPKKGSIDFLIDGEEFFHSFIGSIKNAEDEILVRTYIFDNDDYAVQIADLLKSKSKEVEVKVLMDEIGSMTAAITNPQTPMPIDFIPPKRIDKYLEKNSKINARTAKNPWFTVDHNKVMIFDKKMAYMGGMNIGKEYRYEWHDMMVKVEGPIVGVLGEDFEEAWAHAGWIGDLDYFVKLLFRDEDYKLEIKDSYIDILPIYTKTGKTEILKVTLEAIKAAKKEILIENAYFSDDNIIKELIKARQRGVDVKVILPYWGNHNIMNSSNMVTANNLIKSGIKVYLYPIMNHVKASIFDGFAMVGTANYDKFSMRVNQEINFCFWDKNAVNKLKIELFEKDLKESMLVTGEFPILWVDFLLEKVANQL